MFAHESRPSRDSVVSVLSNQASIFLMPLLIALYFILPFVDCNKSHLRISDAAQWQDLFRNIHASDGVEIYQKQDYG